MEDCKYSSICKFEETKECYERQETEECFRVRYFDNHLKSNVVKKMSELELTLLN